MRATPELRSIPSRPAILVHTECPLTSIGTALGPIFGEVADWAGAHHVALGGPAVARYVSLHGGACEVDAGFVVASAPEATDARVKGIDLGGCTAVCATHMGSYETLGETYAAMEAWMRENNLVSAGPMWEEFFSPPDTPANDTRTDVYWPVRLG